MPGADVIQSFHEVCFRWYLMYNSKIEGRWILVDANSAVLGRLASALALILRGKRSVFFAPHINPRIHVVVINAAKVALTGAKSDINDGKIYYRHTGFQGGIKKNTAGKILRGPNPEQVIILAVRRMLPRKRSSLTNTLLGNLRVYGGETHPHQAQNPIVYDFIKQNVKNSISSF